MRQHIPALDGVRGLAILLVIWWHATAYRLPELPAGIVLGHIARIGCFGVGLFFVLSGFLITRILLDTCKKPRYFTNFYTRRALRIFPLYYVAVAFLFHTDYLVRTKVTWFLGYGVNVLMAFEPSSAGSGSHFWSLCVEEQFYLLWPIFVWGIREEWLRLGTMGAIALSWGLIVWAGFAYYVYPMAGSVLLPFRLDALLIGALIAMEERRLGGNWKRWSKSSLWAAVVSFELWLGLMFLHAVSGKLTDPSLELVSSDVAWGFLLLAALSNERIAVRFAGRTLRSIGKYSYCMYVVHIAVIDSVFALGIIKDETGNLVLAARWLLHVAVVVTLTYAVAYSSWHLYEKRWLELKRYFEADDEMAKALCRDSGAIAQ